MNLNEVPQTEKLRCPASSAHKTFYTPKPGVETLVDNMGQRLDHQGPVCLECGSPARVREQLNG